MTNDTPTTRRPDGGPAFPNPSTGYGGMSLRDWFAGQALAGLTHVGNVELYDTAFDKIAVEAYRFADAMIAHRNATRER